MNRMKNPRFASKRDADKDPASTSYSENEIEHENDLSVAGIAALLASAAIAQQRPPHNTALPNVPTDARVSVALSGETLCRSI